jgi:hypothetical protein
MPMRAPITNTSAGVQAFKYAIAASNSKMTAASLRPSSRQSSARWPVNTAATLEQGVRRPGSADRVGFPAGRFRRVWPAPPDKAQLHIYPRGHCTVARTVTIDNICAASFSTGLPTHTTHCYAKRRRLRTNCAGQLPRDHSLGLSLEPPLSDKRTSRGKSLGRSLCNQLGNNQNRSA